MTESAAANYKGAFGKRIGFGKRPALLMIDLVEAFRGRDNIDIFILHPEGSEAPSRIGAA